MTCPTHGDTPYKICHCGQPCTPDPGGPHFAAYHSKMSREDAIAEARRLGDASEGDGWRRLLYRLATLLAGED